MDLDSRPFWKPRDLAKVLDVSPSQVYRLIEDGKLAHVKVGARAVRIPASAVATFVGTDTPATGPQGDAEYTDRDLDARTARFVERTDRTPDDYIDAWRRGVIEDTPEHAEDAMEALALRAAGVGSATPAGAP